MQSQQEFITGFLELLIVLPQVLNTFSLMWMPSIVSNSPIISSPSLFNRLTDHIHKYHWLMIILELTNLKSDCFKPHKMLSWSHICHHVVIMFEFVWPMLKILLSINNDCLDYCNIISRTYIHYHNQCMLYVFLGEIVTYFYAVLTGNFKLQNSCSPRKAQTIWEWPLFIS
jgi:hypothetical protein